MSVSDPTIRRAVAEDAAALSTVALAAKATWGYPGAWLEAWRGELTLTVSEIEQMTVLVAECEGAIVGFGAVQRITDGWELAHLWVIPSHGGRGIGRMLLAALAASARRSGAARLRIDADPHAVRFYASQGAVRIGEIPAPMPGAPARSLVRMELGVA